MLLLALLPAFWVSAQTGPNCSDLTACNYTDGSTSNADCEYVSCAGCMEPLACNYDAAATKGDGSCVFVGNSTCAECSWAGGPNPSDGSGTLIANDDDGDGICNALDSCSDTSACNYDDAANAPCNAKLTYYADEDNDGIGDYVLGAYCVADAPANSTTDLGPGDQLDQCTDPYKCNYDDSANGACEEDSDDDDICDGSDNCINRQAPNYDDPSNAACCDDTNQNGVCDDREVVGCTDDEACNYLSVANVDNGTCKFVETGSCDACLAGDSTVTVSSSVAALLGLGSTSFAIGRFVDGDSDDDGVCNDDEVVGCVDDSACNYNEAATESCYFDEELGYGVTPSGESCSEPCAYNDVCGVCGGSGEDVDDDGTCDDVDNCTNVLACNYDDSANEACQFLTECGACAAGTDANNDGYIDGDDSDSDDDGVCDDVDNCTNANACNYMDPANGACKFLTECGDCVAGTDANDDGIADGDDSDSDDDGLCDAEDNCTDTTACNYDIALYPGNMACLTDTDGDGVCDPHEVPGCQDPAACNYHATSTDSAPTLCAYASNACETCSGDAHDGTDEVVLSDSDGDGICDADDLCSDVSKCNYSANPTESCGTDTDLNGVCDEDEVEGCRNATACNYNGSATRDDGTCTFPTGCQTCSGATDGSGTVVQRDDDFDGVCNDVDNCSDPTACNYIAAASGNASCTYAEAGKTCAGNCITDIDLDGICDFNGQDLCTDQAACNFNDPANTTCLYRNACGDCGETEPGVLGYDPEVYCDCDLHVLDALGNCGGGCTADVDGDGICDNVDPCLIPGETPDECGVCAGPGAIYECGCFELPSDACDCEPNGTVSYPVQGQDCDGNCLYGYTIVEGDTICKFFDNAEVTVPPQPFKREGPESRAIARIDPLRLEEWLAKFDTLHSRMSRNLDDGSLTGASERLTIEEKILDKGELSVLGKTHLSGFVQMDSNVVVLGNLLVEQDMTIKGTTFSLGGIETSSMNMSGDLSVGGATVIDSTLEVLQSTLLHDSLTVLGRVNVGRDRVFTVDTLGNTQINGQVTILDSLIATTSGTRLSDLTAESTVVATLDAKGDATFENNVAVDGNVEVDGRLQVNGNASFSGSLDVDGASTFTGVSSTSISNSGNLSSSSIDNANALTTGYLDVKNATTTSTLNVASTAEVGGTFTVTGDADAPLFVVGRGANNGALGSASLPGDFRIYASPSAYLSAPSSPRIALLNTGAITATGTITGKNFRTTAATELSTFAGSVKVMKATELAEGILVKANGGNAFSINGATGAIAFENGTSINGNTTIASGRSLTLGSAGNGANLTVNGTTSLQGLTVAGAATFNSALNLSGATTLGGALTMTSASSPLRVAGQLVVGSSTNTPPDGHLAYFDGGAGGTATNSGIAIRLNHANDQPRNEDNFITFYNKNASAVGRIQGEYSGDWRQDRGKKLSYDEHVVATTQAWAEVSVAGSALIAKAAIATYKVISQLAHLIPDSWMVFWPSIDFGDIPSAIGNAVSAASEVSTDAADLVLLTADAVANAAFMAEWNSINNSEFGVAYATGNGDYAEWIPRANPREELHPRQIVAVKRGEVSLRTDDFDHLMVISSAPAVLGKMPADEEAYRYEKVAFLGQVPVEVVGEVASGDYILPTGDHDGYGIAVSPDDMLPEQIPLIVGVAWEAGTDPYFNVVNVVVGLDHSSTANRFAEMREQLGQMRSELDELAALMTGMAVPEPTVEARPTPSSGFFSRLFGKGSSPVVRESSAPPADLAAAPSMLEGMSKEDILEAVEATKDGRTPAAWQNVNSKELSAILQTVVETFVDEAEQEARTQADEAKEEAMAQFPNLVDQTLSGYHSVDDILRDQQRQLADLGVDPEEMRRIEHEFMGRILASEFSLENIQSVLRQRPEVLAAAGNIKPGTLAEERYIQQIQYEIVRVMQEEAPEVAEFMPIAQTTPQRH